MSGQIVAWAKCVFGFIDNMDCFFESSGKHAAAFIYLFTFGGKEATIKLKMGSVMK